MNTRTPYEQQLAEDLKHLSLPDEDKAWAAMQRLLDKSDNDRPPVAAPIPRRGCGGWAALLVILLLAGGAYWYFFRPNDEEKMARSSLVKSNPSEVIPGHVPPSSTAPSIINGSSLDSSNHSRQQAGNGSGPNVSGNSNSEGSVNSGPGGSYSSTPGRPTIGNANGNNGNVVRGNIVNDEEITPVKTRKRSKSRAKTNTRISPSQPINTKVEPVEPGNTESLETNQAVKHEQEFAVENMDIIMVPLLPKKDSSEFTKVADSSRTDTLSIVQKEPKDSTRRKKISFAAGVAIQHSINFNGGDNGLMGKKPYNGDYLPSAYLRLYRGKWFLQTEFRYGAPQNVKGFTYRTINQDTVQGVSFSTSYALRRVYYHQFPISLHYMIKPGWSIGAGVVYNRFTGTVSEKSLRLSVAGTPVDTILEKNLVDAKYDSAFSRNTWQWMAESQYKWKRFSFGLRYASGLQPFIRYRDPNGSLRTKKQQSLNVFIRYELWRSRL